MTAESYFLASHIRLFFCLKVYLQIPLLNRQARSLVPAVETVLAQILLGQGRRQLPQVALELLVLTLFSLTSGLSRVGVVIAIQVFVNDFG